MSENEDHPHPHAVREVVPPKYASFLREIQNTNLSWVFQIVGGVLVNGKIIDFLWDQQGVPITLMVMPKGRTRGKPVEILWTNIQTIKLDSEWKQA